MERAAPGFGEGVAVSAELGPSYLVRQKGGLVLMRVHACSTAILGGTSLTARGAADAGTAQIASENSAMAVAANNFLMMVPSQGP